MVAITIDDFRNPTNSSQHLRDFHDLLTKEYHVKQMGWPYKFLGWSVSYRADGRIHIWEPTLVRATIQNKNENMGQANGRTTPCNIETDVYVPTPVETPLQNWAEK